MVLAPWSNKLSSAELGEFVYTVQHKAMVLQLLGRKATLKGDVLNLPPVKGSPIPALCGGARASGGRRTVICEGSTRGRRSVGRVPALQASDCERCADLRICRLKSSGRASVIFCGHRGCLFDSRIPVCSEAASQENSSDANDCRAEDLSRKSVVPVQPQTEGEDHAHRCKRGSEPLPSPKAPKFASDEVPVQIPPLHALIDPVIHQAITQSG